MLQAMTQADYARHRGVTRQMIGKLVKAGKIKLGADGLIDPAEADFALGETRERINTVPPAPAPDAPSASTESLTAARADAAGYEAKLKRLKYEQAIGQLVPSAQVAAAAAQCSAAMARAIDQLVGRADDVLAAAQKDGVLGVRSALRTIARELRARAASEFEKMAADAARSVAPIDDESD